ncbi:MAG: DNA primase [Nitrospirota bacterium]
MKADRLLEEIKSQVDIVEFLSDYVRLKKSGQNYKGLCPFHSEKTPSFMVSPSKQIFHCFGCGTGGDVVTFLMKHDNISFIEAVKHIAKKAGIAIGELRFEKGISVREKILLLQKEALKSFKENLVGSGSAQEYLKKRGIEDVSIESFNIGYATAERDALSEYLRNKGHGDPLMKEAGLTVFDERGYRDIFRGRIIFPIFNLQNEVIGFGGRVLDDGKPKYINSPETEVFKKSEILYALNLSKDEIRKKGYAIIVEGYLDTIMCHQYGFRNTVAPLGTSLTSRHLQRLKLFTEKAVLVFDSDDAGVSAARRSLAILCDCNFRAKVLLLPRGEDPDSFLRKSGNQPFKNMLSKAMSIVDFLMVTSKGDKIDAVREALGMIAGIKDMIIAEELLSELTDRSKINESALRGELAKIRNKLGSPVLEGSGLQGTAKNKEEQLLLSAVIAFPEKAGYVLSKLNIEELRNETVKSLFRKIKGLPEKLKVESLLGDADETEKALITKLSLKPGFDFEHVDRNIDDCLQSLAVKRFEERRREAEESGDIALLDSFLKEKRRLIKEANL